MSSETLIKIILSSLFTIIGILTVVGAIKEGHKSMKELNAHEELKKRRGESKYVNVSEKNEYSPAHSDV